MLIIFVDGLNFYFPRVDFPTKMLIAFQICPLLKLKFNLFHTF